MTPDFQAFMSDVRGKTDSALAELLQSEEGAPQHRLNEAMRYAVLNGGKRVRPALCFAAAMAAKASASATKAAAVESVPSPDTENGVLAAACAVELVHAYSLVHDDLPAMDDDDLRRGKPTTHIAYDEATAVLAGDALQTKAFEILANSADLPAENKVACIQQLARGAGDSGMCGGQMVDLEAVGQSPDLDDLALMHEMKTGALIRASVLMGAIASGLSDSPALNALSAYAEYAGLAFQVKDDILDATTDTETLGKRQGADAERNKPTYVSHLGLEGAEARLSELYRQALDALAVFGEAAATLTSLTDYIVQRRA